MSLEKRISNLEKLVSKKSVMQMPQFSTDDFIRKLRLDPAMVRAIAKDKGASLASVIAYACSMPLSEFKALLKSKAQSYEACILYRRGDRF